VTVRRFLVSLLLVTALFLAAQPARADDVADLNAKLDAAAQSVTSMRMTMSSPTGGVTETMTIANGNAKVTLGAIEVVVMGKTQWVRTGGGPWKASFVDLEQVRTMTAPFRAASAASRTNLELLPDRIENGVAVGVFRQVLPALNLPQMPKGFGGPSTMTCSYDKLTYHPLSCTIQRAAPTDLPSDYPTLLIAVITAPVTMTYDRWNDPSLVVEAPDGAPTPSPAPQPAATG